MSEFEMDTTTEQEDDLSGRFLTFYVGDTIYGVELLHVIEIVSVQPATHVPGLPAYFKGLINLRGKVVPVVDIRLKLGLEERAYDDKTCYIIVTMQDMQVGLIVDCVDEAITVNSDQSSAPPVASGKSARKYISSVATIGEKIILNLDCEKFFQDDLHP